MTFKNKKLAIISVSNKKNIDKLAKNLIKNDYIILSTGGTAKFLSSNNIKHISISKFTDFEEILEGRVKTLHPKIHAGILAKNQSSISALNDDTFALIDMVIVNLYPFEETISKKNCTYDQAIENIDIGGPTMLRAAAKNHQRVTVVTDPDDYKIVIDELDKNGETSIELRTKLAKKVFEKISHYDLMIYNYLNKTDEELKSSLPNSLNISLVKNCDLRYGENPHQKAAIYDFKKPKMIGFDYKQLVGKELSYNNLVDAESALACVKQFRKPSCVIVKHANPCGVAESDSLLKAYNYAYKTDPVSAFGGIIAFNKPLDSKLLKKIISQQFVEVILAPGFDNNCIDILKSKPNIRLLLVDKSKNKSKEIEMKTLKNKMLIQETDSVILNEKDLKYITKKKPTKKQVDDLLFAFKVSRYVKSNSIVFAKDGRTLGIGAGQMSRIDSTNIAKSKAKNHKISLKGCVMASEAFFPFRDNIDLAKKIGVVAIIQPGGSIKDKDIIEVVDKYKMSMVLSGVRVFKH